MLPDLSSGADCAPLAPRPDAASAPFFAGAAEGRLMLQRCDACGTWTWPLRPRCVRCFAADPGWTAARGRGTLWSAVVVHQRTAGFAGPFGLAIVALEEGPTCCVGLEAPDAGRLPIGTPLEVVFDHLADGVGVPRFREAKR